MMIIDFNSSSSSLSFLESPVQAPREELGSIKGTEGSDPSGCIGLCLGCSRGPSCTLNLHVWGWQWVLGVGLARACGSGIRQGLVGTEPCSGKGWGKAAHSPLPAAPGSPLVLSPPQV